MNYEYMVVYTFPHGTGRMAITTNEPIKSYEDIERFDKVVRESTGIEELFVSNFKLLNQYYSKDDEECKVKSRGLFIYKL